ncbi:MAG: 3-oxoacyl-[acyl-carrier-protein] reductase [Gammaproteobacteria bacterium]|nr:3-oxoacyl-[acyl-carrier-protein] reductase [Gammaproteobacteria bacterium]MXW10495.1 3-oxoacyl-[acyl-carrier-protein] reductase [Gammaproteobacteria bacterium]MYC51055.1 3-oxoacyl-[acyl-carrier-protein] reductase [Gammaproteobacteria bacterium]
MSGALAGQIALVTGGSRGIGFAISQVLAQDGARVAIVDIDEEGAVAAAARLEGAGHAGYFCDVGDAGQCRATVAAVTRAQGIVTILINNAGITRDSLLVRMKDEDWNAVIRVNLTGAFNMTRAASRGMMKRRSGSIVNISSVIGLMGNAGQTNYGASKAGLVGLTKSVAREFAKRGVRCNAIAPGYIATDMTAGLDERTTGELGSRIPMGRLGEPSDVAGVARFLAGPEAGYVTGQVLAVDGGMAM